MRTDRAAEDDETPQPLDAVAQKRRRSSAAPDTRPKPCDPASVSLTNTLLARQLYYDTLTGSVPAPLLLHPSTSRRYVLDVS